MTRPAEAATRPAFYALAPGGWRDYVTLLHLPYTSWHLSYVVAGAALSTTFSAGRLAATGLAFLLAVGIGAHALDELMGRPLATRIPRRTLAALGALSIGGAIAIGIAATVYISPWIALFVVAGVSLLVAYNLELWNGRFHTDAWFGLAWGGFPVLCAYFAQAEAIDATAIVAAAFGTALALAQRQLSTWVRHVRRSVRVVRGTLEDSDGNSAPITVETLTASAERGLQLLTAATVLLAVSLLLARLT